MNYFWRRSSPTVSSSPSAAEIDRARGLLDVHSPLAKNLDTIGDDEVTLFKKYAITNDRFRPFEAAKYRLNTLTANLLQPLWQANLPVVIGGGSVLECLSKEQFPANPTKLKDYDLFFLTQDVRRDVKSILDIWSFSKMHQIDIDGTRLDEDKCSRDRQIDELLNNNTDKKSIRVKIFTDLQNNTWNRLPFDMILEPFKNGMEVLTSFDLDCCRFLFNGQKFITTMTGLTSYQTSLNILRRSDIQKQQLHRLGKRIVKYASRGYATKIYDAPDAERYQSAYNKHAVASRSTDSLQHLIETESFLTENYDRDQYSQIVTMREGPSIEPKSKTSNEDVNKWFSISMP